MKLLHCRECHDVVGLLIGKKRYCQCGKSSGLYVDPILAEYSGPADIFIMNTSELMTATPGRIYSWWVAPPVNQNISRITKPRRLFRLVRR
jgi:hypothetical protein